jgi:hypothetical protein
MIGRMRAPRTVVAGLVVALAATGCSWAGGASQEEAADPFAFDPAVSLTPAGADLAAGAALEATAPRYDVTGQVAPATGKVTGTVRARLHPGADVDAVTLRYFAGLPDFDAGAAVGDVRVDGDPVEEKLDGSILTVPLPADHGRSVDLTVPFSYSLALADEGGGLLDALGGMGGPADVGLLSRHPDALNLGHWFPIWVPPGNSAEPDPAGFGDIGNFPAALIRLDLTVPRGWTVVDGGVRIASKEVGDDRVRVVSEGYGMNDMVVSLLRGYRSRSVTLDGDLAGVRVTAYAPADAAAELPGVLEETTAALVTLSDALVAYPWREFDLVSAPLGSGVGGMEWPGATWIEPTLLAGGIPGLGDLGDLGGLGDLGSLDGLGGLLGGDTGVVLDTLRPWTIAHEVGHEWWHILVGNDSILDPVVDEPLAQYSACLVLRAGDLPDAGAACRAQIDSAYEQMRMLGDQDAPADRSTDDFDSSGQYAGVVYGKAAAFYLALEDAYGAGSVADALGQVARERAFTMTSAEQLRDALGSALGQPDRFDRLWRRWMERTQGDADLGVSARAGSGALGGLGDLGNLGDLEDLLGGRSPEELQGLIDQLLGGADPGAA